MARPSPRSVTRRDALRAAALAAAGGIAVACSPAAAPISPQPSAGGQAGGWEADWQALIQAAKQEGKVVVQTPVGAGFREALDAFAAAFPGVEPEQQAFPDGATYIPKIQGERKAGIYSFDVAIVPAIPPLQVLKAEGTYQPLKPVLFRPDVLDDKAWYGGFDSRWADREKNLAFRYQVSVTRSVYINTDLTPEDSIKTLDDLLDPKWKGKIVMSDVRQGYIYTPSSILRETKGDDWLKKLLIDQQPMFIRDRRQAVEALVRGTVPLGFGINPRVLQEFVDQGVAKQIKNPDIPGAGYGGGDVALLFDRAPHPSAAKLFLNWLLTREGGEAFAKNVKVNSGRTDVAIVDPSTAPKPGVSYPDPTQEDFIPKVAATQDFLIKLVEG